jgi:hypothetical protein
MEPKMELTSDDMPDEDDDEYLVINDDEDNDYATAKEVETIDCPETSDE